jgi:hypothetical protein
VSEKYVVVVSNSDKICRSCANLLNTVDRLEFEATNTKQTLLSSLERKYSLHNDDLYKKLSRPNVVIGNAQNFKTGGERNFTQHTGSEKVADGAANSAAGTGFKGSAVMPGNFL